MAAKHALKISLLLAFVYICSAVDNNTSGVLSTSENAEGSLRILSRRKRYLVFPDGSSFQLVFCTQNQGYLQIGDIVWFGNTAALAWELPTDPKLFYFFKEHEKVFESAQNRDGASKHIYYLDEKGKVLSKMPYKKKFLVNPAFAKRSISDNKIEENHVKSFNKREMHENQMKLQHLEHLDEDSKQFHREGRLSLFAKLEKFLKGLGWRGKECVLRMLCESANTKEKTEQGTFFEEILRATFTLPAGKEFADEEHKLYDKAYNSVGDCAQLYPRCMDRCGLIVS